MTKTEDFQIPICQMKLKGVTTQMKDVDKYTLMVMFLVLLQIVFLQV